MKSLIELGRFVATLIRVPWWVLKDRIYWCILLALAVSMSQAAVSNVRIVGATPTGAILLYVAPTIATCTLEASEESDYSPVVNDVNTTLFSGAATDNRAGNITNGRERGFVIGKRTVETAADGFHYSRALQAHTVHYYRITCGADTATGTFTTANIPLGSTYPEALPSTTNNSGGWYSYPSINYSDRSVSLIDPVTGAKITPMSVAFEWSESKTNQVVGTCTGTNWTTPGNCTTDDGNLTTYANTSRDVLVIPTPYTSVNNTQLFSMLTLDLQASISGSPTGDDKYADLCISIDGTICDTPWKGVDLTTCSTAAYQGECVDAGSVRRADYWASVGNPAYPFYGWEDAANKYVLLKPRTTSASYTISVDVVRFDAETRFSGAANFPAHAGMPVCSTVPITDDGDGDTYYLCRAHGSGRMYSVSVTDGRAYYLGPTPNKNVQFGFSPTDGRVFYAADNSISTRLLKGTWSSTPGAMRVEHTGNFNTESTNLTWTTLTPAGCALGFMANLFDADYDAEWLALTTAWTLGTTQNGKIQLHHSSGADRMGWVIVYDPAAAKPTDPACTAATGNVVAAYFFGRTAPSKYCVIHTSYGDSSTTPWVNIGDTRITPGAGFYQGPWQHCVRHTGGGDLLAGDTELELVKAGACAGFASFDPTDSAPGGTADATIPASAGDIFFFDSNADGTYDSGDEYFEIISIAAGPPPVWTVRRATDLKTSPYLPAGKSSAYATSYGWTANTVITGACRNLPLSRNVDNGETVWNFEADPTGETVVQPAYDGTGTFPPSPGVYGSGSGYASPQIFIHELHGGHGYTQVADIGKRQHIGQSAGPDCITIDGVQDCWRTQSGSTLDVYSQALSDMFYVSRQPSFATKRGPTASSNYQDHEGFLQRTASAAERRWSLNVLPFMNATGYGTAAASPEAGTTNVFKVTSTTLDRKHLGTLATCGSRILRDISSATTGDRITDATPYTYCVALTTNECRTGAVAGDVYVNCPGKTGSCAGSASTVYPTTVWDVCVGDHWVYSNGIAQLPLWADSRWGERARMLTQAFAIPHLQGIYASAKATAGGEYALFLAHRHEGPDIFMAKVPPYPAEDSVNRRTFVPVPIQLGAVPAGTTNIIVEFGYDSNFYCSSRGETCVTVGSIVDETTPFYWASESYTGLSCAVGCTPVIPALPSRILYYRVKYRDATPAVLVTGSTQVIAVP